MARHSAEHRVKLSVHIERPILAAIADVAAAERRSHSSTVEVLVAEAIDARARAAERSQDARTPSAEGQRTGGTASEALSAAERLGGGDR